MKRYNKDGYHTEHNEGVFVLYEDAKRKINNLKKLAYFAADRLEAAGLPGHTTPGENMRSCDEVRQALAKIENEI